MLPARTIAAFRVPAQRNMQLAIVASVPLIAIYGTLLVGLFVTCPKGTDADLVQEWTSSRNYWTGRPIYESLDVSVPRYLGTVETPFLHVNAHPPVAVVLGLPLGLIDYFWAWRLWNLLSLILLGGCVWLLLGRSGLDLPRWSVVPVAALLLGSEALQKQVIEGQLNIILLSLLVGAWQADRHERTGIAGALVGTAAAIKLFPALAVVYFLCQWRWRAVVAAGGTFIGLHLVAAAVLGPDVLTVYIRDVLPQFDHYRYDLGNLSLTGLASKVFMGEPPVAPPLVAAPGFVTPVASIAGLAVVGVCTWAALRADTRGAREIAFALTLIAMLLVSPIVWEHGYLLLLLPVLVLWRHSEGRPWNRAFIGTAICLPILVPHHWLCIAFVPGYEALMNGGDPSAFTIHPSRLLTVYSYTPYILLALLLVGAGLSHAQRSPSHAVAV